MKKKASKILIYSLIAFWVCYLFGFGLTCAVRQRFDIRYLASLDTLGFFALFVGLAVMVVLLYYYKHYWLLNSKNIIKGKQSDLHLAANLEQSRFESDEEIDKNFTTVDFDELKGKEIAGTPIKAVEADGHLRVTFAKPSHSLIIGTTGSGKTTTFVSPTIQILSELKNHPSMLISDPKGELYADHSEALKAKGYEVKVLDLRNPYNSVRWNPLERPYLLYQRALHLDDEVKEDEERGCWTFDGTDYFEKEKLDSAIQVKRQLLNDMVYEDLNDICTVLCPVTNKDEPMWESGAKNFILAIALAMLADSADPTLGMSKEKYNFFSLTKVATSTDDDCKELLDYFKHRSPLSKAVSLSKQVLDSSDKTRGLLPLVHVRQAVDVLRFVPLRPDLRERDRVRDDGREADGAVPPDPGRERDPPHAGLDGDPPSLQRAGLQSQHLPRTVTPETRLLHPGRVRKPPEDPQARADGDRGKKPEHLAEPRDPKLLAAGEDLRREGRRHHQGKLQHPGLHRDDRPKDHRGFLEAVWQLLHRPALGRVQLVQRRGHQQQLDGQREAAHLPKRTPDTQPARRHGPRHRHGLRLLPDSERVHPVLRGEPVLD
jgi:hypothetical protein